MAKKTVKPDPVVTTAYEIVRAGDNSLRISKLVLEDDVVVSRNVITKDLPQIAIAKLFSNIAHRKEY